MFALVDCNNFYASCERLFRPDLRTQPIIVLSNNDGCVIARSNEAKALGVKMGEPFFKIKNLCRQLNIQVFSSNYALYGDLSHRVMSIIEEAWPEVEVYSIDEAFLDLSTLPRAEHEPFCLTLQQQILKSTGIPTSIGIGPTKTLSKLANVIAKKKLQIPVVDIQGGREWLDQLEVGEVWGVGRRWQARLLASGIATAGDLARASPRFLKEQFNVTLLRTAMELTGVSCLALNVTEPSQSIVSSRSFGCLQTEYEALASALSAYCFRAWEKLRTQQLHAQRISVFVQSNRFRADLPQYNQHIDLKLPEPTDDLRDLTHSAKCCLKKIFKPGIHYQKVGVLLTQLSDKHHIQLDLLSYMSEEKIQDSESVMSTMDDVNQKFGRHTLYLAAESTLNHWAMKRQMISPCYTTRWSDLPRVKCGTVMPSSRKSLPH